MKPLFVAALMLSLVTLGVPQHRKSKPSVTKLHSRLSDVRRQKERVKKQLRETKRKANAVVEDIHVVDSRLERLEDQLEETTGHLATSREAQRKLSGQLSEATQLLEITRKQVRERLRVIYKQGPASSLSALVGTRTSGDLATRQFILQSIARRDHELFDRYTKLQTRVAQQKREQDRLVQRISGLVVSQKNQQENLESTRGEKADLLKDLRSKQGQLQQVLAQFEEDERSIAAEIAAYSRRHTGSSALPAFTGRFVRPCNARITSGFGMRYHPILHYTRLHAGIDFGAPTGAPIMAAAAGRIVSTSYGKGYGNRVLIDHGGGVMTVYMHCSRIFVQTGQMVRQGERIAAVGSTGLATGPHLHFEVRVNGVARNPLSRF